MLARRIIPCLDVKHGRTVKGVNFVDLRDAGDPVELAEAYSREGADELVFLDITATHERRKTLLDLVHAVARVLRIPFTVGGGIGTLEDAGALLEAGTDKVSINTAAVLRPEFVTELAEHYGSQFVVAAVDARLDPETGQYHVYTHGGRTRSTYELGAWLYELQERGAGEILLTSMDADGTKAGFDLAMLRYANQHLRIPLIASGGAGTVQHFVDCFQQGGADAALAASVFHFREIALPDLKQTLHQAGLSVRL
jgi:imidazole glycerol-phosphate synthase subunit HisF